MNKHYKLIVGSHFSLSNETDCDSMSDYFPGIWAIKTQKSAIMFAKRILADGDSIEVTDYDNPTYHATANKFIKELGINQPLFSELVAPKSEPITNGKPSNLNQLKKFLSVGTKIRIVNTENPDRTRDTEVIETKTQSVVTRKGETGRSHLDFGTAINWTFDNSGATYNSVYEGKFTPIFKVEYINS